LRVVTFNAEWLFLDASNCPGEGCYWQTAAEALDHLYRIADNLRELDADVINLVEVQDCSVLSRLNEAIGSGFGYRYYLVKGTDTATNQNVAMLTRVDPVINLSRYQVAGKDVYVQYPLPGSHCNYTGPARNSSISKHYYARLQVNGISIVVVGLHFIAFPTTPDRCSQREAQSVVASMLVQQQAIAQGYEAIVMGDLNDFDGAIPDIKDDKPTSSVLQRLSTGLGLTSIGSYVSQDERYSCWWDENGNCRLEIPQEVSTIDHILLSSGLKARISSAQYAHIYVKTCNDPDPIRESDHWPVVVDLDFSV